MLQAGLHPFTCLGPFLYYIPMDVSINPTEMHDFASIFAAMAMATKDFCNGKLGDKETAYIAGVSLLGPSFVGTDLLGLCRCLAKLTQRRVFVGLDSSQFPLPSFDPELEGDPYFFTLVDTFIGVYAYYLYSQKKLAKPEEGLRPITFLLYEAFEGIKEGMERKSEQLEAIYVRKLKEFQDDEEIVTKWKTHLEAMGLILNQ